MIDLLDKLISQAQELELTIKYIALSETNMKLLTSQLSSFSGKDFTIGSINSYKEVPIKEKNIMGFQIAYDFEDLPF